MLYESPLHDPRQSMLMDPIMAVHHADRHRSSPKIVVIPERHAPDTGSDTTPSIEATTIVFNESEPLKVNESHLPRSSNSSASPIVVVVAPRSASFESDDPLFRGICLYNGTMKSSQRHEIESQMRMASSRKQQVNRQEERRPPTQPRRLWRLLLPSVLSKSTTRTAS